jgi:hypothetical protein
MGTSSWPAVTTFTSGTTCAVSFLFLQDIKNSDKKTSILKLTFMKTIFQIKKGFP